MKVLYSILLSALGFSALYSQKSNERESLIEKERTSFASKMTGFNINPNTLNYDLQYQRMDVSLDPTAYYISGSVTSHFKPNQNMSSIYFDLANTLIVSQVKYRNQNIPFQHLPTKEIKIDFPNSLPANTLDSLTIYYAGAPDTANNAFSIGTQNGTPILSTLNEPYGAQDWFPTKQSMNDKIDRFDFKINTPFQYSVAANGRLMSETNLANNRKLTFWRTMYPTPAYLIALSITNFVKINDTMGNPPFPFVNYLYPATVNDSGVMNNINWTKDVMNTFETYFGPYPFRDEKYGHMEFHYNGVCMEHQTMSSMSSWGRRVIAHELAHQWFGDKVTCGSWNDIWLNEGFATFGEHLANEKLLMTPSQFISYLQSEIDYITQSPSGSTYVDDASLNDIYTVFSARLSYSKGGYIIRMLKWILGETQFYQAVRDYHNRPNLAYAYASTADFKASLQQSTGRDFTEFLNDWLYGQGYPTYDIRWKQIGNTLTIKASQTQSHNSVSFFEMPLPIKVIGTSGQVAYLALNNTYNNEYFTETVAFPIASVEFNYEKQILEKNSLVTQDNTLQLQEVVKSHFVIYPNPADKEIEIKGISKNTPFKIYSSEGRLVKEGNYTPGRGISIAEFVKGTYFITINNNSVKFIKK